jgi:hypothetical protein
MKDAFGIISAVAITAAAFAVLVSATAHGAASQAGVSGPMIPAVASPGFANLSMGWGSRCGLSAMRHIVCRGCNLQGEASGWIFWRAAQSQNRCPSLVRGRERKSSVSKAK